MNRTQQEFQEDWAAEEALEEATGMKDPDYKMYGRTRRLTLDEMDRFTRS